MVTDEDLEIREITKNEKSNLNNFIGKKTVKRCGFNIRAFTH